MSRHSDSLAQKIQSKQAQVGVVGLGYVGLPLVVEFAEAGFTVTGIDLDQRKVDMINKGESYIQDIPTSVLKPLWEKGRIKATTDFSVVEKLDTINICVPTPLGKSKEPDISYIVKSCESLAKHFYPGILVILESTTYPGTTDELILPMFEAGGLKVGEDFFMCFSPERVDPGNAKYQTKNIPKVVGGITPTCTEMGAMFYGQALDTVVPVGSTRVAEMVKVLENTFRMINIGMVNEIARMCDRMNINV
jgi:UDP-N-acetyl-D-glucosamine dehydrogenase